jgi:hypothetical protein
MMEPFRWTCPFCDHKVIVSSYNYHSGHTDFTIDNADGAKRAFFTFIVCPNPECKKFTFSASLYDLLDQRDRWIVDKRLNYWRLIPPSQAKVYPEYIPKPIRDDYLEACLIRDLSPKASATLSRRCLQGMIRDFWGVAKATLKLEIEAIGEKVDPLTWKAIDAVRKIGNIGAHMEKDINLIVDVDPDEASQLINLIEILVKDWYITRYERQERLESVVELGEQKDSEKEGK